MRLILGFPDVEFNQAERTSRLHHAIKKSFNPKNHGS